MCPMETFESPEDSQLLCYDQYGVTHEPLHAMRFHWFPKPMKRFIHRNHLQVLIVLDGEAELTEVNGKNC